MWNRFSVIGPVLALVVLAGCSEKAAESPDDGATERSGPVTVTATTGMVADLARNVGRDHVEVTGLMGPGVDPHLYQATQSDLRALSDADLILYNGLHLEGRMADILVKMAHRVRTVPVTESIPKDRLKEPPEFQGNYDPHVWFDLSLWRFTVEVVRDALSEIDPDNAEDYGRNAEEYMKELDRLHHIAKEEIGEIPEERRVLITAHDAFGYFGDAYGLEVMGLQGISTASDYGLQDVNRLVDMIVERKIKAVFVETSVPTKSIEALIEGAESKGHEVEMGGELFSDAMGEAGTPEGTFTGMFRHNVETIAEALK